MGSIIGHRIDYNGVGALKGQQHIPSKNLTLVTPGNFVVRHIEKKTRCFSKTSTNDLLHKAAVQFQNLWKQKNRHNGLSDQISPLVN